MTTNNIDTEYIIKLFVLIQLILIPQYSFESTKEMKTNTFQVVNENIQGTLNKLFNTLNFNKNFTTLPKYQLLSKMHTTMQALAEKNYQDYKNIKRAAKLFIKKKTKKRLFNLDKLITILEQEKLVPSNIEETNVSLNLTSLEIPENSEESFAILREYLNNVESADYLSIDSPNQRIKDLNEKIKRKVNKTRNLKAWKRSNFTEHYSTNMSRRVFHGSIINIKIYPFVASVHVMGDFVCGGSIISKDKIITAATCILMGFTDKKLFKKTVEGVTVRIGSDFTNKLGEEYKATNIHYHPKFDPLTLQFNLAIIKLNTKGHFNDKRKLVRRIQFQRTGPINKTSKIMLLGWGDKDKLVSNQQGTLSSSFLDLFNLKTCKDIYNAKYVTDKNFCAGHKTKGSGACQRDVGSPAIIGSVLVGVVSFGPPTCGTPGAPTVFIDLYYHIDWINSIVKIVSSEPSYTPAVNTALNAQRSHSLKSDIKSNSDINPNNKLENRLQYPETVNVLTYLLNNILSAGQKVDDVIFGTSNKNYTDKDQLMYNKETRNVPTTTKPNEVTDARMTTPITSEDDKTFEDPTTSTTAFEKSALKSMHIGAHYIPKLVEELQSYELQPSKSVMTTNDLTKKHFNQMLKSNFPLLNPSKMNIFIDPTQNYKDLNKTFEMPKLIPEYDNSDEKNTESSNFEKSFPSYDVKTVSNKKNAILITKGIMSDNDDTPEDYEFDNNGSIENTKSSELSNEMVSNKKNAILITKAIMSDNDDTPEDYKFDNNGSIKNTKSSKLSKRIGKTEKTTSFVPNLKHGLTESVQITDENEYMDIEPNISDNYESESGLSIEIPSSKTSSVIQRVIKPIETVSDIYSSTTANPQYENAVVKEKNNSSESDKLLRLVFEQIADEIMNPSSNFEETTQPSHTTIHKPTVQYDLNKNNVNKVEFILNNVKERSQNEGLISGIKHTDEINSESIESEKQNSQKSEHSNGVTLMGMNMNDEGINSEDGKKVMEYE